MATNFPDMEKRHAAFYNTVLKAMTGTGIAVVGLLIVMAITLI